MAPAEGLANTGDSRISAVGKIEALVQLAKASAAITAGAKAGGNEHETDRYSQTYATTPSVIEKRWWVIDAQGMTLGTFGI